MGTTNLDQLQLGDNGRGEAASLVVQNGTSSSVTLSYAELAALDGLSDELALLAGVTASAAEINRLDGALTTVVASKAVIADGDKDIVGPRTIWLGQNGASGFAGSLKVQDGANPGATAEITYADTANLAGITGPALGSTAAGKLMAAGEYTVTNDDATANQAVIATGLTTVAAAIVQIVSATNVVIHSDEVVTFATSNITVADGGATYNTVATDKIRWIAFGV